MLTKKYIPAKYVIFGAILLTLFSLIPIIYTITIAFTNYSTGHIGTKPEAIAAIQAASLTENETSQQYTMLPLYAEGQNLVLGLTEIPQEAPTDTTTDPGATPEASGDAVTEFGPSESAAVTEFGPSDAASTPTEFGPSDAASAAPSASESTQTEFGPGEATSGVASPAPAASGDTSPIVTEPDGGWPPSYIGTNSGLDEVPPGDVQRDEFGTVTGVNGYATVPEADYPGLDSELAAIKVPGPNGGYIVAQGFTNATELYPTVTYDQAADTFTNTATGVVYTDNGAGSFTSPDNPDDELNPGWKETVGWKNFTAIITDPDVRAPFFQVFVWTFVYAFLTVLLTFAAGLGLAIALNRPGMKGQRIYRAMLILPYAVPAFLSALVFAGLLNDDFGAINTTFGLSIPWLFDPFWAKVSCLLLNFWLGVPYMFLISTGALQAIPSELQEAARIDGARNFQVFRLVNLPLLLVALTPLLVASFAFNFNNFNNIYLLTGGGPAMDGSSVAGSTDILISYTYKIAFAAGKGNDFGLASAISIIIFLIIGTISAISFARSKALREERA
jgi:arabinogalactan oligomer/maltooligosaccharide transport system permease protein